MSADTWLTDTRASYDTVAASYADQVRGALTEHRYLRVALAMFADTVLARGGGLVADVGCGPGHVTAHLHALGLTAFGVDLSPGMIDVARREYPELRFDVGSMTELELPADSLAGVLAWQSLIHLPDAEVLGVFERFHHAVRPGGPVQLLFHVGDGVSMKTEGYGGHPIRLPVHRRQPEQVANWLRNNGFELEAQLLLDPGGNAPQAILFARNNF